MGFLGKFFGGAAQVAGSVASANPVTAVSNVVGTVLDRVLPDKVANDAAKATLLSTEVQGAIAEQIAQLNVNQAEASSGNKFAADWRPMFGYCCAFAFAWSFLLQPVIVTFSLVFRHPIDMNLLPKLDMSTLMTISLGMLGIGGIKEWNNKQ
jgi:hypothetical protein